MGDIIYGWPLLSSFILKILWWILSFFEFLIDHFAFNSFQKWYGKSFLGIAWNIHTMNNSISRKFWWNWFHKNFTKILVKLISRKISFFLGIAWNIHTMSRTQSLRNSDTTPIVNQKIFHSIYGSVDLYFHTTRVNTLKWEI